MPLRSKKNTFCSSKRARLYAAFLLFELAQAALLTAWAAVHRLAHLFQNRPMPGSVPALCALQVDAA
jgi:hypothetical protein